MSVAASATGLSATTEPQLPLGSLVSDTFEIEALLSVDSLGATYQARDKNTRKPVSLFVLSAALSQDAALAGEIRASAEQVMSLQHAGLVEQLAAAEIGGQL